MEVTISVLDRKPTIVASPVTQKRKSVRLANRIKATVSKCTEGKPIFVCGAQITSEEIARDNFLLPAILLAIADNLGASADANSDEHTFSFRMKADQTAVLMFEVVHIEASSPRALSLATSDILQRSESQGEFILDSLVTRFGDFLKDNDIDIMELEL